jgi:hypothetical protein
MPRDFCARFRSCGSVAGAVDDTTSPLISGVCELSAEFGQIEPMN